MDIRRTVKNKFFVFVIVDFVMMALLIANLGLILFEWFYGISIIREFFAENFTSLNQLYQKYIHENFQSIDLVFVMIFLAEFALSWILAIIKKVHSRWYFYPFVHWYDLIGCIPVGSFRFLRLLRLLSIVIRLQNLGVVDISKTSIYAFFRKIYAIFVEEISDKVVANILEGIQGELKDGGVVVDKIIERVIKPRKEVLTEWISRRLEYALVKGVISRKSEIHDYVAGVVNEGLQKNEDIKALSQVPLMGNMIATSIEKTISNVVNNMIDRLIADLGSQKNKPLVHDISTLVFDVIQYEEDDVKLNKLVHDIAIEVLEEVKSQVLIKKWLIKEQASKNVNEAEKLGIEVLMTEL